MNERIRELMKQSGAYSYYDINEGVDGDELPMVKFAELIVKDCFDVVIGDGRFHDSKNIINASKAVAMEHFGVK